MRSVPSRIVEKILSLLIPPACREEVLGDLYELCEPSGQFIREALRVLPMVLFSRIRRTADPSVLMMHAAVLYLSYLAAAWHAGTTFLFKDSGLLRLAIPPACVLVGLMLDDAYSLPGKQGVFKKVRAPVLGLGFAYLFQGSLSAAQGLALPRDVMFFGSAAGLLFSTGLRSLFPPASDRPAGAGVPAHWLKHAPEAFQIPPQVLSIAKTLAFVLALVFVGGQMGGQWLAATLVLASILLLIVRELKRRG